jgi:anti-sigma B factor antagonist
VTWLDGSPQAAGPNLDGDSSNAEFELVVTEATADQVVVAVRGEIDLATAERFGEMIENVILPGARLVIDLSGTRFIDCTGLDVLVHAHARLIDSSGTVIIRSPSSPTKRVLEMVGLDQTLTIEP